MPISSSDAVRRLLRGRDTKLRQQPKPRVRAPGTIRAAFRQRFQNLEADLTAKAEGRIAVDLRASDLMLGEVCLAVVDDAVTCHAGGRPDLASAILERASGFLLEAWRSYGIEKGLDSLELDRVDVGLAYRVGQVLEPDHFPAAKAPPIPFDAFPDYISSRFPSEREEKGAACFLWGLLALLEKDYRQHGFAVIVTSRRSHREFDAELTLLPHLPAALGDAHAEAWDELEPIMVRWMNPGLRKNPYAYLFQRRLAAALSLLWTRYREKRTDPDTFVRTYFGEALGVDILVL
jgi:hypothetical protein